MIMWYPGLPTVTLFYGVKLALTRPDQHVSIRAKKVDISSGYDADAAVRIKYDSNMLEVHTGNSYRANQGLKRRILRSKKTNRSQFTQGSMRSG